MEVELSIARITSNPVAVGNLEEKIRFRAYELFQTRGAQHGHDLDDWLQAEAEFLRSKAAPAKVAKPPAVATAASSPVKPAAKRTARTKRT